MESYRAEIGTYGASGRHLRLDRFAGSISGGSVATALNFTPRGNSKMNYARALGSTGLTYTLTVTDPSLGSGVVAYKTDQTGAQLARLE